MRLIIILFAVVTLIGCKKESLEHPDCEKLKTGIIDNNEQAVKTEIEKQTADLNPVRNAEDNIGHSMNLQILAERISDNCSSISASTECYACIETYPPTSEIRLEFENGNSVVVAIIDIITPEDDILRFGGMHLE